MTIHIVKNRWVRASEHTLTHPSAQICNRTAAILLLAHFVVSRTARSERSIKNTCRPSLTCSSALICIRISAILSLIAIISDLSSETSFSNLTRPSLSAFRASSDRSLRSYTDALSRVHKLLILARKPACLLLFAPSSPLPKL